MTSTCAVGVNPISRLIQIQQARKEKEPLFSLVAENGVARSREFVFQVCHFDSVTVVKCFQNSRIMRIIGYA